MIKKFLKLINIIIIILALMTGCGKNTIKIGFIGDLSTKNSQLAIDGRNAAEYYIKKVNEKGGINGHPVELVVKDDRGDAAIALEKHQQFKDEGIHYVIGHFNSNMSEAILESADEELLFFSPSMSSETLTGRDDYIIRSCPTNRQQADIFFEYAIENNIDNLLIVYDKTNADYTKSVADKITDLYEESELNVVGSIAINTKNQNIATISKEINEFQFDNIFILAQSTDTAYIIQNFKKECNEVGTFSVSWSMTNDFIQNGGKAVQGTIFVGVFEPEICSEEYNEFKQSYFETYKYDASFISMLSYDAIKILIEGMEEAEKLTPENVKEAIIQKGTFECLYQTITIDDNGDSNRSYLLYELEGLEFKAIR